MRRLGTSNPALLVLIAAVACGRLGYDSVDDLAGDGDGDSDVDSGSVGAGTVCEGFGPGECDGNTVEVRAGSNTSRSIVASQSRDRAQPSCGNDGAADLILNVRAAGDLTLEVFPQSTNSSAITLAMFESCGGSELQCMGPVTNDASLSTEMSSGQTITLVIESADSCTNGELSFSMIAR